MSFNDKMTNLANAIREKTNQTDSLSLDEMASSIRSIETNGGANNTPVTTEYVYTYSGDTNDDSHGWVYNYGKIKVFAKIGDIPEGTLNLVGSTIFRTNPSNEWLNKTFTITQDHLDKTLHKSGEDIPATQDGLIQIYDMMASDFSEFTVLCICTKPGWYNVTFDDWFEIIQFTETGIFAYEKRTYGGNDYLKTFTFTATVYPESGDTPVTPSTPAKYTGNEITMFSRGICIGDSVTEGSFDNAQGGAIIKRFSYPAILERITGVEIANAGIAGMTSKTWYEASLNSESQYGKWVNQEWVWNMNPTNNGNDVVSSALDYSNFEFAIIHLGINDLAGVYDGTTMVEDILVNYETYINNIITKLKEANVGIKIFLMTIIPSYALPTNPTYNQLNNKIKEIANYTENTYLVDLNKYSEVISGTAYSQTHPTALGYQKMATEIKSLISYIIKNNLSEFNSVQFIGTDYTI